MERAPLRPVPRRPAGPVDPLDAAAAVAAALPDLDAPEREALALIALSGRTRAEAAARMELEPEALAEVLARSRKALRRSVQPLRASGWCERAELLISDRLDGALDETGAARLSVHLSNCPRCVAHERQLVQATDLLVARVAGEPGLDAPSPAAPLALVSPATPRAGRQPIAAAPFGEPVRLTGASAKGELVTAGAAWIALLVLGVLIAVACAVAGLLV
jgi:hypothetical protein